MAKRAISRCPEKNTAQAPPPDCKLCVPTEGKGTKGPDRRRYNVPGKHYHNQPIGGKGGWNPGVVCKSEKNKRPQPDELSDSDEELEPPKKKKKKKPDAAVPPPAAAAPAGDDEVGPATEPKPLRAFFENAVAADDTEVGTSRLVQKERKGRDVLLAEWKEELSELTEVPTDGWGKRVDVAGEIFTFEEWKRHKKTFIRRLLKLVWNGKKLNEDKLYQIRQKYLPDAKHHADKKKWISTWFIPSTDKAKKEQNQKFWELHIGSKNKPLDQIDDKELDDVGMRELGLTGCERGFIGCLKAATQEFIRTKYDAALAIPALHNLLITVSPNGMSRASRLSQFRQLFVSGRATKRTSSLGLDFLRLYLSAPDNMLADSYLNEARSRITGTRSKKKQTQQQKMSFEDVMMKIDVMKSAFITEDGKLRSWAVSAEEKKRRKARDSKTKQRHGEQLWKKESDAWAHAAVFLALVCGARKIEVTFYSYFEPVEPGMVQALQKSGRFPTDIALGAKVDTDQWIRQTNMAKKGDGDFLKPLFFGEANVFKPLLGLTSSEFVTIHSEMRERFFEVLEQKKSVWDYSKDEAGKASSTLIAKAFREQFFDFPSILNLHSMHFLRAIYGNASHRNFGKKYDLLQWLSYVLAHDLADTETAKHYRTVRFIDTGPNIEIETEEKKYVAMRVQSRKYMTELKALVEEAKRLMEHKQVAALVTANDTVQLFSERDQKLVPFDVITASGRQTKQEREENAGNNAGRAKRVQQMDAAMAALAEHNIKPSTKILRQLRFSSGDIKIYLQK